MEIGTRIARAQVRGLSRTRQKVVAGPLVGFLHDEDLWYLSGVLAAAPGQPVDPAEVPDALERIRAAFTARGRWVSVELVEEASPGLAEALAANGMRIVSRPSLLAVEPAELLVPELPAGVTVEVIGSSARHADAEVVAADAYEAEETHRPYQPDPANGGGVLVRVHGVPAATAAWTPASPKSPGSVPATATAGADSPESRPRTRPSRRTRSLVPNSRGSPPATTAPTGCTAGSGTSPGRQPSTWATRAVIWPNSADRPHNRQGCLVGGV